MLRFWFKNAQLAAEELRLPVAALLSREPIGPHPAIERRPWTCLRAWEKSGIPVGQGAGHLTEAAEVGV